MKKVFVLFLLFFLLALSSAKEASAAGTHVDVSTSTQTVNAVEASPSQEINSNSEAQPLQMQELSFIYPSGLFVNASDLRNIMDLLRFIHENPCPYRWQLEKWAKGGCVDIIMSTTNEKSKKSDSDRICLFLEIEDFFWIWARDPKTGNVVKDSKTGKFIVIKDTENAYYRGAAVGNVKKKSISLQALSELALEAMDYNHNALEIRARVVAEKVEGKASGFSIGGGGSKISGSAGFTVPAMLGWSKSQTGKIGLDGIQVELYERKKGVNFDEEAAKIRRQVEKIWDEQKKAAQDKKEIDRLKAEIEKKKLEKELEALKKPPVPAPTPPVVIASPPRPPVVAPPAPVVPPRVEAPPKPKLKKIEPCLGSLLFDIDDYMPNRGKNAKENYGQAEEMILWIMANEEEVKKHGGKVVIIGGCDERLVESLKKNSEKYAKDLKSLVNEEKALVELHPYPTDKDYINPLLGERRARLTKVYLGMVAGKMGVLEQIKPILKSLPVLSSGKDWLVVPNKPLDDKNRYAMLAVVIGGPDIR